MRVFDNYRTFSSQPTPVLLRPVSLRSANTGRDGEFHKFIYEIFYFI